MEIRYELPCLSDMDIKQATYHMTFQFDATCASLYLQHG